MIRLSGDNTILMNRVEGSTMKKIIFCFAVMLLSLSAFSKTSSEVKTISDSVEIRQIAPNTWLHTTYMDVPNYGRVGANGLVYIQKKKAFLIDSPWTKGMTKELVQWILDSLDVSVDGFIPTHWHEDCMGGLEYLQTEKVHSYANEMTVTIAKEKELPLPDTGFTDSLSIPFGKETVECYYFGAAHSTDNIVVWLPGENVLFAGCILKGTSFKSIGYTKDGDINAYAETVKKMAAHIPNAEVIVPGHGACGGYEIVKHTETLLDK